jgi:hypothetical protein
LWVSAIFLKLIKLAIWFSYRYWYRYENKKSLSNWISVSKYRKLAWSIHFYQKFWPCSYKLPWFCVLTKIRAGLNLLWTYGLKFLSRLMMFPLSSLPTRSNFLHLHCKIIETYRFAYRYQYRFENRKKKHNDCYIDDTKVLTVDIAIGDDWNHIDSQPWLQLTSLLFFFLLLLPFPFTIVALICSFM